MQPLKIKLFDCLDGDKQARDLGNFALGSPTLIDTVKLPNWTESERMAWPPPVTPKSVLVAEAMAPPPDARFTANWAASREKDTVRRAAVEARWAKRKRVRRRAGKPTKRAYDAKPRLVPCARRAPI